MPSTVDRKVDSELMERACIAYSQATSVMDLIRLRFWDSRGLTMSQLRLLAMVDRGENRPIGELADEMGVKPATLSGLAERLERLDFIKREHDPADRRIVRVVLTPEGKRILSEIQVAARAYFDAIFARMGPEAVERFAEALEGFRKSANSVGAAAEYLPR
ncbi:MAG TPA: MarR family transcriptional regulator [Dehalococcoidia bacterium]